MAPPTRAAGSDARPRLYAGVLIGVMEDLGELVEAFLADVPPRLVALRGAAEEGDARSVVRIAHTLEGSCGSVGAASMGAACAELEEAGRAGELSGAPAKISVPEKEFGRVRVAFEEELRRSSGAEEELAALSCSRPRVASKHDDPS